MAAAVARARARRHRARWRSAICSWRTSAATARSSLRGHRPRRRFPALGQPDRALAARCSRAGLRARLTCVDPRQLPRALRRPRLRRGAARRPAAGRGSVRRERRVPHLRLRRPDVPRAGRACAPARWSTRDGFVFADLLPAPPFRSASPPCWRAAPSWCSRWGWATSWSRDRTSAITPTGSSACRRSAGRRSTSGLERRHRRARAGEAARRRAALRGRRGAAGALAPDVIITQTHCEVCAVSAPTWRTARPRGCAAAGRRARHRHPRRHPRRVPAGGRASSARPKRGGAGRRSARAWRAGGATAPLPHPRWCAWNGRRPFRHGQLGTGAGGDRGRALAAGHGGAHSTSIDWQAVADADPTCW